MTIKKIMAAITATVLCFMLSAAALAESLVPGGGAVGIRMTTDGVVVAGISEVETSSGKRSPAADAGLKKGDVITRLGGSEIATAQDFKAALSALDGSKTTVTFERGGKQKQLNITPAQGTDGAWKLGLWLRDGISGVGTLTFYDPATGVYGALGHCISGDDGEALPLGDGGIYGAEIVGIVQGTVGAPGQLDGKTDAAAFLGDIRINCGCGIFGTADFDGETMETGEFETGPATIRCTLEGSQTREYGIEIKKVYSSSEGTTVMLTVTDPELIALTGGIVQGMSGSPIIQNGRLVGAVTHVFVNDPTSGYGVSIEDMLRVAQHVS
ncbi:MAG: PDZ domain-containing protein [Clostridiales bacterium]|nr:PDZ domain-containing protein [Clostridiales bacterium]